MKIFNFNMNNKNQTININGYIIDKDSGELIKVPIGLTIYEIPSEVTRISISVLNSMKPSAIEVNFSNNRNITSLPFGAFSGFHKLSKVVFPPNLKKMDVYFDHNSLSKGIQIVLPNNLEQFAQNQFSPSKTKLKLDDTVMIIKQGIVSHNNVLEELIVPGKIKFLEKYCVNQVRYLRKIWLKEGIIRMDDEAIRGCNNLREIHIPASLKLFKLGNDDYRAVKEFEFSKKRYAPSPKQIEEEKNRTIKLYKTIHGEEILFEVNRNSFEVLLDSPTEFVFEGYGHTYRVTKKSIENCKHIVVDIANQKIYNQDESQAVNGTFINSSSDRKIQETAESNDYHPNNLNGINISAVRTRQKNPTKKDMIENLLKTKISNIKKVKNQSSGVFETILKSQRELSDEMVFWLEEIEEDYYDEGKIDGKTYLKYMKYLKEIYGELISNAPFETGIIDNSSIEEIDKPTNWQIEMMKKYDMSWEEIEKSLLHQKAKGNKSDEPEFIDSRKRK